MLISCLFLKEQLTCILKKQVKTFVCCISVDVSAVPEGQTMYTKQKCKDGLKGACFELVNAAGQAEVSINFKSKT